MDMNISRLMIVQCCLHRYWKYPKKIT